MRQRLRSLAHFFFLQEKNAHSIDPAKKICIVLSHPSDKNKGIARVGHPNSVTTQKGRINKLLYQ
jgi:hypothetical protein